MERIVPQRQEFTATGAGTPIEIGDASRSYSLQVVCEPVTATSWSVDLEVSLDGVNFQAVLTHTTGSGDGGIETSGGVFAPCLFIRSNVKSLVLGSSLKIAVYILGV